jgi:hypothetical protein
MHFKIFLKDKNVVSPTNVLIRSRVLMGSIRRSAGKPALLDISVGNHFSVIGSDFEAIETSAFTAEAGWINSVSSITLLEHVELTNLFILHANKSGWKFTPANIEFQKLPAAKMKNRANEFIFGEVSLRELLKKPYINIPDDVNFVVGCSDIEKARIVSEYLRDSVAALMVRGSSRMPGVTYGSQLSPEDVNLWVLEDSCDLSFHPDIRARMSAAEKRNVKFKICKFSTARNNYALANITYDMLLIAGMVPYVPVSRGLDICSVDAGHCRERKMSRWVCAESNMVKGALKIKTFDTALAEHIPAELYSQLWPETKDTLFCRDGRFSKETQLFKDRARLDGRQLIQCKKSPRAVMWQEDPNTFSACTPGDCVIDPHGEILLQTMVSKTRNYIRPLRLEVHGSDKIEIATTFFQHQAFPGLSLTSSSKLPGSLYFADLVSKLTESGWAKAIGRGWGLDNIVP